MAMGNSNVTVMCVTSMAPVFYSLCINRWHTKAKCGQGNIEKNEIRVL